MHKSNFPKRKKLRIVRMQVDEIASRIFTLPVHNNQGIRVSVGIVTV